MESLVMWVLTHQVTLAGMGMVFIVGTVAGAYLQFISDNKKTPSAGTQGEQTSGISKP